MNKKFKLDNAGNGQIFFVNNFICNQQSKYQKIEVCDLNMLGRTLILDDIIQLSELDCDVYHESFAHMPVLFTKKLERVLILGGGDGILAKELLKYENLKIDLVDIDEQVVDLSKKYLSRLNNNALVSERVNVYNQDALAFCKSVNKNTYDVIYGDITDPHPDSPSSSLLSQEAIETYKNILSDDGVLAIQTDNVQVAPKHVKKISNLLEKYFTHKHNFAISAITLGGLFSFVCVTNSNVQRKEINVTTNWLDEEKVKTNLLLNTYALSKEHK